MFFDFGNSFPSNLELKADGFNLFGEEDLESRRCIMVTSNKPRVMFVDDDPMLLASTRRQLVSKLGGFELVFCASGIEALAAAGEVVPEIVFSDVRMPEMDGPELLRRFAESHPHTVRFALTGQSYEDQFDRTCSVTHQIFSKPFESEKIRRIVENVMLLRREVRNASIHASLIRPLVDFPDLGNVASVIRQLSKPDLSVDKVVQGIEKDFTAKAHLLSMANSAFVAPVHPVSTVNAALLLLGPTLVKSVFLAVQANRMADRRTCAKAALDCCLRTSISFAGNVQKVCRNRKLDSDLKDLAVMGGTLKRFGRILFTVLGDDDYCQLGYQTAKAESELELLESRIFKIRQEIVGAYVLLLWGMDPRVCLAIADLPTDDPEVELLREVFSEAAALP